MGIGINRATQLEQAFRTNERMLWGLSYRLTGCAADADDIVQETFVRAAQATSPAETAWRPWLVRVATNLGLDVLRRRKRRASAGVWLPSPIEAEDDALVPAEVAVGSTEQRYAMLESVSFAFLLTLEALSPRQRAVLILRDVFDYSAKEVASALEMSEANVRITHLRARRVMSVYDHDRCVPTPALQARTRSVLEEFVRCLINQDVAGVEALLSEGVRTVSDGGEYTALHGPLIGRSKVALLHLRVARRRGPGARIEFRQLNGLPAVLIEYANTQRKQAPRAVLRCDLDADGRIRELHAILASHKLTAVRFESQASL